MSYPNHPQAPNAMPAGAWPPAPHGPVPHPGHAPQQTAAQAYAPHPGHGAPAFSPQGFAPQAGFAPHGAFGQPGAMSEQQQMLAAFVGPNAHRFLPIFHAMDAKGSKVHMNWVAFFFSLYWLAYRKLYAHAAAVAGALLLPMLFVPMMMNGSEKATGLAIAMAVTGLPIAIAVGLLGDSLVKKKAEAAAMQAWQSYPDPHHRFAFLSAAGGVSVPALIGCILGWSVLSGAVTLIAMR